ncbi:MAG: nucleotidyltransferase family protein [Anaerolineae bacterium]
MTHIAQHTGSAAAPQAIVSFVQALVSSRPQALGEWLAANRLDAALAAWLHGQGMAPFVFYRLRQDQLQAAVSSAVLAQLQHAYYLAASRAALRARELTTVLQALAAHGVVPVLFKGAVLAHTVYPNYACRPMSDLDLWLSDAEIEVAIHVLAQIGYVQRVKPARPAALQALHEGEFKFYGPTPDTGLIELHRGVFAGQWLHRTTRVRSSETCERLAPVVIAGQPAKMLSPEDALLQLALHLAVNHQFSYPWVRGLVDIALLARQQPVDWVLAAERARAWRVATPTWLALDLALSIVGLSEARPALARLAPSPLRRWVLHLFVNPGTLLQRRNITTGPLRFLFLLAMVDRPLDAGRLLGRAVWPEEAWLAARYGTGGLRVRARHTFNAMRGRL